MKKIYSVLLLTAIIYTSKAQHVFTAANTNPVIGDNYILYPCDTTGVTPGSTGSNHTWDFHSLAINTSTPITHWFRSPASLSGCQANRFPSATIEDSVSNTYYRTDNNSISLLGYKNLTEVFTDDTNFVYPFSFGSNHQNNNSSVTQCTSILFGTGSLLNKTYDGYGTLILPGITYNQVARTVDAVAYSIGYGLGNTSKGKKYTYRWYESGIKFPVLIIEIKSDSSYISQTNTWIANPIEKKVFVNGYNGVGISEISYNSNLSFYPNPMSESSVLKFDNAKKESYSFTLYDSQGKVVQMISNIQTQEIQIHKQDFIPGFYFFQLLSNKQVIGSGKLIIK